MIRPAAMAALLLLAACEKPAPPPQAPAGPSLTLTAQASAVGASLTLFRFQAAGIRCGSMQIKLMQINPADVDFLRNMAYDRLPHDFKGEFVLTEQRGEPFGKTNEVFFDFDATIPTPNQMITKQTVRNLKGPFLHTSQHFHSDGQIAPEKEVVVFARCMSRNESHDFGSGDVEYLKKHAAETKDVIIAVTLRWDPE